MATAAGLVSNLTGRSKAGTNVRRGEVIAFEQQQSVHRSRQSISRAIGQIQPRPDLHPFPEPVEGAERFACLSFIKGNNLKIISV